MKFEGFARRYAETATPYAFGVPGGGASLSLADALIRHGVRFVTTGHEMTAALMAGGLARIEDRAALCLSIKGPGFANLAPGLLCNRYEMYPCLAVTETYPSNEASGRRHKWMNHGEWSAQACKHRMPWTPDESLYTKASQRALAWPPGPVHIELGPRQETLRRPNEEPVPADALAEIENVRRPALVVGSAVRAFGSLRACLEGLELPIFTTASAKGVLDENHPNAAGVYTGAGTAASPEGDILPAADALIFLGVSAGELLGVRPVTRPAIYLQPEEAPCDGLFPPCSLSPERRFLSQSKLRSILDELANKRWGIEAIQTARGRVRNALLQLGHTPAALQLDWAQRHPPCIHVLDTGAFTVTGEHVLPASPEQPVIGTPNSRYMGAGLGIALGAGLNSSRTPVVLWVGDGGFLSMMGELRLAEILELPLLVLHLRDGQFGSIVPRAEAAGLHLSPLEIRSRGAVGLARALGLAAHEAPSLREIRACIDRFFENPRPTLIDCPFDREVYGQAAALLRK